MATNAELKTLTATQIRDKTSQRSITKTNIADRIDACYDYTDQQAPIKTSAVVTLTGTQTQLPKDINFCNFTGGKAYLPATTMIGREYIVLAVSNNIEIFANAANDTKMFITYPTLIASVVLTTNQMYRFTYLGIGTGTGGVIDGYWKAELIN